MFRGSVAAWRCCWFLQTGKNIAMLISNMKQELCWGDCELHFHYQIRSIALFYRADFMHSSWAHLVSFKRLSSAWTFNLQSRLKVIAPLKRIKTRNLPKQIASCVTIIRFIGFRRSGTWIEFVCSVSVSRLRRWSFLLDKQGFACSIHEMNCKRLRWWKNVKQELCWRGNQVGVCLVIYPTAHILNLISSFKVVLTLQLSSMQQTALFDLRRWWETMALEGKAQQELCWRNNQLHCAATWIQLRCSIRQIWFIEAEWGTPTNTSAVIGC